MTPDFDACGAEFLANAQTKYADYIYRGKVTGILATNRPPLITTHGCEQLCGTGTQYYEW